MRASSRPTSTSGSPGVPPVLVVKPTSARIAAASTSRESRPAVTGTTFGRPGQSASRRVTSTRSSIAALHVEAGADQRDYIGGVEVFVDTLDVRPDRIARQRPAAADERRDDLGPELVRRADQRRVVRQPRDAVALGGVHRVRAHRVRIDLEALGAAVVGHAREPPLGMAGPQHQPLVVDLLVLVGVSDPRGGGPAGRSRPRANRAVGEERDVCEQRGGRVDRPLRRPADDEQIHGRDSSADPPPPHMWAISTLTVNIEIAQKLAGGSAARLGRSRR